MHEEQEARELERLRDQLGEELVSETASRPRRRVEMSLSEILPGRNIRTGELPDVWELARSIRERGLLQPLLVRQLEDDGGVELVAGYRRYAACELVDPEMEVPVELFDELDDDEAYELMLLENVQRVELEPMVAARGLRMLMHRRGDTTAADVAKSLGLSTVWVRKHLGLLDLPEEVQKRVASGDLSVTSADMVRRAVDKGRLDAEEAVEIVEQAANGKISAADLKAAVNPAPKPKKTEPSGKDDLDDWGDDANIFVEPQLGGREDLDRVKGLDSMATAFLKEHQETAATKNDGGGDGALVASYADPQVVEDPAIANPAWSLLDAYLLTRLAADHPQVAAGLGLRADTVLSLSVPERIRLVRRFAQELLRADEDAHAAFAAGRDAELR